MLFNFSFISMKQRCQNNGSNKVRIILNNFGIYKQNFPYKPNFVTEPHAQSFLSSHAMDLLKWCPFRMRTKCILRPTFISFLPAGYICSSICFLGKIGSIDLLILFHVFFLHTGFMPWHGIQTPNIHRLNWIAVNF